MLKIGDFSRVAQVTIKTLRYYDRIGLLKPSAIDPMTGYRYYRLAQLNDLNRILMLKELGFSLEQIQDLLRDGLPLAEIRGMLMMKQADVQRQMQELQQQNDAIAARLKQIEQGHTKLPDEHAVVIKQFEGIKALSVRDVLPGPQCIGDFFCEVRQCLAEHSIYPAGPIVALYHFHGYRETDVDIEIAVPVILEPSYPLFLRDDLQMTITQLPTQTVASCVCIMRQQADVREAIFTLYQWIETHGYQVAAAPYRETYAEPARPGEPIVFEIQQPIQPK